LSCHYEWPQVWLSLPPSRYCLFFFSIPLWKRVLCHRVQLVIFYCEHLWYLHVASHTDTSLSPFNPKSWIENFFLCHQARNDHLILVSTVRWWLPC
jgi:hypothetical protein